MYNFASSRSRITKTISRLIDKLDNQALLNRLTLLLAGAAVLSGLATYAAMGTLGPFDFGPNAVFYLLNLDVIILLLLAAVIARRVVGLWLSRKRGIAGANLQIRLVLIFGLLASIPAIIMTIFAAIFFHYGIESWFADHIRMAVQDSRTVAKAYLREHQQVIQIDALGMANDLNRALPNLVETPEALRGFVSTQAQLRNLPETQIFTAGGEMVARTRAAQPTRLDDFPRKVISKVNSGIPEVIADDEGKQDRVYALLKLESPSGEPLYLYVGRQIEEGVLEHIRRTESAVTAYEQLQGKRSNFQVAVTVIFLIVGLLLLMVAVLFGLSFAGQLVDPLRQLIIAAERVRRGHLDTRVTIPQHDDELGILARAFNRMTDQLNAQRSELLETNRQLDQRNRFTEAMLAGVTAGVLGLDHEGYITLANQPAAELLEEGGERLLARRLDGHLKPLEAVRRAARLKGEDIFETQREFITPSGKKLTLLIRVTMDREGESAKGIRGYVMTFDDISQLQDAQRNAAWRDVAQRIAHEIKNPLTPIQLAAERLERRYLPQIKEDPETFSDCVATIDRQVDSLRHMVNEFSQFARMPKARLAPLNLVTLIREAITLQRQASNDVQFVFEPENDSFGIDADRHLLMQALTNLYTNAVQAMSETEGKIITTTLTTSGKKTIVTIQDTGAGIPEEMLGRILEPYVTTKEKGTGLGLTIVRKVIEEHGGRIDIRNTDYGAGAQVTLTLPSHTRAHSGREW